MDSRAAVVTPPPPVDLRDDLSLPPGSAVSEGRDEPSLMDDFGALVGDAKTYLEAELTFQKSRAGYAADRLKWTVAYGAAAFAFLHLALIALTVGLIFALSPLTGPWIATGIVVAMLLAGALVFVLRMRKKLGDIQGVLADEKQ